MSEYKRVNARHSACKSCGGILTHNIAKNIFECTHCGNSQKVELGHKLENIPFDYKNTVDELPDDKIDVVKCKNCGAEVILDNENDVTGVCPYCDSNYVSDFSQKRLIAPSSLIPFKIDRKQAEASFKKWVKKLKGEKLGFSKGVIDTNIVQTYRPFWVFNANVVVDYRYEDRVLQGGRTVIANRQAKEDFNLVNVGIDAMYSTKYVDRIDPDRKLFQKYDFDELVEYDDAFLTGTQTSVYLLDLGEGLDATKSMIGSVLTKKHIGSASDFEIVRADDSKYSLALMPVWEARMVFKDEVFIYSLNGQTGKQFGEYPRNWMFASSGIKVNVR